jgi:hypothetical protein
MAEAREIIAREGHFPYLYRWDRQGRKGQPCGVLCRGTKNSILVEFEDGYTMVTSGNAIRRRSLSPKGGTP